MSKPSILQLDRDDLRQVMDLVKEETKREMNCHAVGTIESFDPVTATASVIYNYRKVLKKANSINPTEYTDVVISYPKLIRCPVIILSGGGAYTTFPIAQGDECLLMFNDRDMDLWLQQGTTQNPPNTSRMHDLSDAIALVGVRSIPSIKKTIPAYSTNSWKTVYGRVVAEFTNLVASIKDKHGERLVPPGTGPIPSFARTPPNGWLFMYGQTLGKAGSGAVESSDDYDDLFDILKFVVPNSAGAIFAAGDKILIPDCRGRAPVFKNDMGGNNSSILTPGYTPNRSILGAPVGEEAHQLTVAELARHYHLAWGEAFPGLWPFGETGPNNNRGASGSDTDNYFYNTSPQGNDVPHNNVGPGIIVNAMIKY